MRARYLLDTENRSAVVVVEETDEDPRYKIEERRLVSEGYRRGRLVCGQIYYPDMMNSPYTKVHLYVIRSTSRRIDEGPLTNDHCCNYPGL